MQFLALGLMLMAAADASAPAVPAGASDLTPDALTCEYLADPIGIDVAQPRVSWKFKAVAQRGQRQTAYQIVVAASEEALRADRGDRWDSGRVASDRTILVPYAGKPLASHDRCYWKVRAWDKDGLASAWSKPASWTMGILTPDGWWAQWISDDSKLDPSKRELATNNSPHNHEWSLTPPSPILRKSFTLAKPVRSATVYVSGLGYYELRLNGRKVGDHVLDPAFTRYDRRVLYSTYDVTGQLQSGKNAFGVLLGNGWYNQHAQDVWFFHMAAWRQPPKLLLQMQVAYQDGSTETIATDASWRTTAGPYVHDGIRNGEVYDARREAAGWDTPAFDDAAWAKAQVVPAPGGILNAQMMPPIRVTQTIKPVKLTEPQPGVFVFDLGQNIAGWAQLKVSGPAGTTVTLRYGERVGPDGMLVRKTIEPFVKRGPFQTDVFILKGQGEETYEPRFAYHGYRWVEVTGLPGKPTLESLRGRVVHTDFARTGRFECSNELLNTIQRLTLWSYRGNYHGYPTDCPHREKNGWTGDAQLACEQAMYNFDNCAAYTKWMNDLKDEQRDSGELPGIVPTAGWGYAWGNGPAWDSAYLLIPWYMYLYHADTRILENHYDRMTRYVDYLTSRSKGHIVSIGLGDWVPVKTKTPVEVTSTGYYFVDAVIVARAATILGKKDDAAKYTRLADEIRQAFNQAFYKKNGLYANGSQTALSCALYQGLADASERPQILARLVDNVQAANDHLDTGILGAKYLFRALTNGGCVDDAYRIATQTTAPSYGDWIARGATTLWEDWNDGSSRNHIMFGDISGWFYSSLAGINADPLWPGFKHIAFYPRLPAGLDRVDASVESASGTIVSRWERKAGQFTWHVVVPPNTRATIYVPATKFDVVREGDHPAADAPGLKFLRSAEGCAVFAAESGDYRFKVGAGR